MQFPTLLLADKNMNTLGWRKKGKLFLQTIWHWHSSCWEKRPITTSQGPTNFKFPQRQSILFLHNFFCTQWANTQIVRARVKPTAAVIFALLKVELSRPESLLFQQKSVTRLPKSSYTCNKGVQIVQHWENLKSHTRNHPFTRCSYPCWRMA